MKFSARQIITAAVSLFVTLGLLLLGQRLYHTTVVESPLMSNLGNVVGVRQARLKSGDLVVRLKPGSDLMAVYQNVVSQASSTLGHDPAKVEVVSNPDETLRQLQASVPFVIAQGEATGHFVAMKNSIISMAQAHNATVQVELGTHHLFLTFHHHQRVLYDVVPITIGGGARG